MCVPSLRLIGTKFTILENMHNRNYILFDVTGRKNSTSYVNSGISMGTFCNKPEVSTTSGSKVMAQTVVFIIIRSALLSDMTAATHTNPQTR